MVNVLIVLIQADGVIRIFYDVLALQFIQKLDDIGFSVSKIEVLGKRLQRATMTPYFYANFEKGKESLRLKKRVRMFLKTAYFINFGLFLSAMVVVSVRQLTGKYQCESITVRCESSNLFLLFLQPCFLFLIILTRLFLTSISRRRCVAERSRTVAKSF